MTIKDVAREAGVSVTTVSHSLNRPEGARVSEETRAHVERVAAALGYRANISARALRTRRTDTIALIGRDLATTEHLGRMVRGAQEAARTRRGLLIVADTGDDENGVITTLLDHGVDGVILGALYHQELNVPAALRSLPTVLANAFTQDPAFSWVVPDEVAGGRAAAEVLLAAGHRRLAMINNEDDIPAARGRAEGFERRCLAAGVTPLILRSAPSAEATRSAVSALLSAAEPQRPTAFFCFSDAMAMGLYAAAAEAGLRIGRDLSVVGFDDLALIGESLWPRLTSVALPHAEMAAWAVDRLFDLLDRRGGEPARASSLRIMGRVVERESVGRPPTG